MKPCETPQAQQTFIAIEPHVKTLTITCSESELFSPELPAAPYLRLVTISLNQYRYFSTVAVGTRATRENLSNPKKVPVDALRKLCVPGDLLDGHCYEMVTSAV